MSRLADLQQRMRRRAHPTPQRGRPRVFIVRAVACKLASFGFSDKEIAAIVGCSVKTLRRRVAEELQLGRVLISGKVKMELVRRALQHGDRRALLLLAKRLKWDN